MISSETDLQGLKLAFENTDKNGDGIICKKELLQGLSLIGINNEVEINQILNGIDLDQNGRIEYTEFLAAFLDHNK